MRSNPVPFRVCRAKFQKNGAAFFSRQKITPTLSNRSYMLSSIVLQRTKCYADYNALFLLSQELCLGNLYYSVSLLLKSQSHEKLKLPKTTLLY